MFNIKFLYLKLMQNIVDTYIFNLFFYVCFVILQFTLAKWNDIVANIEYYYFLIVI